MATATVGGGSECTALSSTFNTTTEVRPLSKAPNPQLLPGRRSINGCLLLRVCVHGVCVCVFTAVCVHLGWVKCRALIPSMGNHTWPHVTSLSLFHFHFQWESSPYSLPVTIATVTKVKLKMATSILLNVLSLLTWQESNWAESSSVKSSITDSSFSIWVESGAYLSRAQNTWERLRWKTDWI